MTRSWSTRTVYGGVACILLAFAFYFSLIPFDVSAVPAPLAWRRFWRGMSAPAPGGFSTPDFLANALLFIPVGFALMGARLAECVPATARAIRVAAGVLGLCTGVSVTVEFLQVFVPPRAPSSLDVLAQVVGGVLGIASWSLAGRATTAWFRAAAGTEDRLARLLAGYAVVWVFVALAPFDITLNLGDLSQRFGSNAIVLVPFTGALAGPRLAWHAAIAVIAAMPLGMAGMLRRRGRVTRRAPVTALAMGTLLIVLGELAQVFIRSQVADATDALFGIAGVALGVAAGSRLASERGLGKPGASAGR